MTKKHFIELADVLRKPGMMPSAVSFGVHAGALAAHLELTKEQNTEITRAVMVQVVRELSLFCRSQNYRFDFDRFEGYIAGTCGPNGGKVKAS